MPRNEESYVERRERLSFMPNVESKYDESGYQKKKDKKKQTQKDVSLTGVEKTSQTMVESTGEQFEKRRQTQADVNDYYERPDVKANIKRNQDMQAKEKALQEKRKTEKQVQHVDEDASQLDTDEAARLERAKKKRAEQAGEEYKSIQSGIDLRKIRNMERILEKGIDQGFSQSGLTLEKVQTMEDILKAVDETPERREERREHEHDTGTASKLRRREAEERKRRKPSHLEIYDSNQTHLKGVSTLAERIEKIRQMREEPKHTVLYHLEDIYQGRERAKTGAGDKRRQSEISQLRTKYKPTARQVQQQKDADEMEGVDNSPEKGVSTLAERIEKARQMRGPVYLTGKSGERRPTGGDVAENVIRSKIKGKEEPSSKRKWSEVSQVRSKYKSQQH